MDLTNVKQIRSLCKQYNIKPRRGSGQNFLVDKKVLDRIVKAADLKKDDVVLEVGPGFGVLTQELAKRVKKVMAVEIDRRLVKALGEILKEFDNLEIVQGDILNFQKSDFRFVGSPTSVVANLPYNITSRFLRVMLERAVSKDTNINRQQMLPMTLMVQKEVAERIGAKPGKMSLLAVSVQFYAAPKIVATVSKNSFWPKPEVDSAIINLKPREKYLKMLETGKSYKSYKSDTTGQIPFTSSLSKEGKRGEFFRIVRIGFSAKRKQLQNNLAAGLKVDKQKMQTVLKAVGLDENVRAQELSVEEWIRLVRVLIR